MSAAEIFLQVLIQTSTSMWDNYMGNMTSHTITEQGNYNLMGQCVLMDISNADRILCTLLSFVWYMAMPQVCY